MRTNLPNGSLPLLPKRLVFEGQKGTTKVIQGWHLQRESVMYSYENSDS
jgi:hypothetical protein